MTTTDTTTNASILREAAATIAQRVATLVLVDITEATALWVQQGGVAALTAADIEQIARDNGVTTNYVVAIAQMAGVDIV